MINLTYLRISLEFWPCLIHDIAQVDMLVFPILQSFFIKIGLNVIFLQKKEIKQLHNTFTFTTELSMVIHGKINTERIAFRCIKLHHKIMWIQEKKIASDRGAVA